MKKQVRLLTAVTQAASADVDPNSATIATKRIPDERNTTPNDNDIATMHAGY